MREAHRGFDLNAHGMHSPALTYMRSSGSGGIKDLTGAAAVEIRRSRIFNSGGLAS